ncbi:adipose-secreted signaling protein isoform X2 [Monodelphis domestica]|uniref:adipose-secreted signaling protein isoform X2 n=1 Tax=Monodelphis domestica TaxID=13616 RepID=UPI0024E271DA|nr:adipose-secreted signaling protein isoform X2 [Monodelphis domestica]XP_056669814.1 adipose-secreted signaling protein isoform X2 [Monodelphis domestica]
MATANKGSKSKVGSIRFTSTSPSQVVVEGSQSHVHFDEKLHDSAVMVTPEPDGNFLVKIGFLKVMHKYEVTFTLPPLPKLGREVCAVPTPSLHLKVLSITPVPEGFCVKCEYIAHKEGVLKEELVLACETNDGVSVRVVLQARVMDRHHGTPMLLDGVRCMGAELEYDSEQSDWRGFD